VGTPASDSGNARPIAVFLLDDHEIVRSGVRDMLEAEGDGVTVYREIRSRMPAVACLMLTSFADDDALMARLRGQSAKTDPLGGLTPQERRILELIGEGLTNRQTGERLFLAEKTVKNYISVLFAKLGMERRRLPALADRIRRHRDSPLKLGSAALDGG
jgi:DNA-binding NarL/FixJ family response regulator